MIKQLQSRILKLEQQLETKEQDFLKKKQNYEKIIEELQEENQKLKNIISELNMSQDQRTSVLEKSQQHQLEDRQISDYEIKQADPHYSANEYSEVIRQNNFLKQQIATISLTYQKQIEELTKYFEKIKSSSRLSQSYAVDAANSRQVSGKISVLMSAYQSLLKNYDSQKQKFTDKIEELSRYLQMTNEKNRKLQEDKILLQKKYNNSEQRIRLYRQNLGV